MTELLDFALFPCLPTELRLAIWTWCLPRRIVDLHDARYWIDSPEILASRKAKRTFKTGQCVMPRISTRRPYIAQVCREAREVALSQGRLFDIITGPYEQSTWFDLRTDSLNITLDRSDKMFVRPRTPDDLRSLLLHPTMGLSVDRRVIEAECEHYKSRRKPRETLARWLVKRFVNEKRRRCSVVLLEMALHMRRDEAFASGLFGFFGEELCVQFDVRSRRDMAQLVDACKRHTAHAPDSWGAAQLEEYLAVGGAVEEDISQFVTSVEALWLAESGAIKDPKLFSRSLPCQEDEDVSLLLAQLPQFTFVITVRLCEREHKLRTQAEVAKDLCQISPS